MNRLRLLGPTRTLVLLAMMMLALSVTATHAAYQISRPVALGDEPILQTRLYGEQADVHKGVDFSAGVDFGDSVYAVASGRVIQIEEGRQDNCHPQPAPPPNCAVWGNYVLIQHNAQHYDRTSGQMAYVYSLYMHLRQNQVVVNVNQDVNAGTLIAQADNTGNSTGHHLHLQIMVHPDPGRTIEPNTLESENRSRNPELWLAPYNGTTGTVVGKVTNVSGDPVGNLHIYGARSGQNPDGLKKEDVWDYQTSLTYNSAALNPDDILVENWGTTDVKPGHYHVTVEGGGDLGWHDVQAGRITYVGLYPVWLPEVRNSPGGNGWISTIVVRNNSDTYRAQINTTFFDSNGSVKQQRTDLVNANATANLAVPAGWLGSALVVSSEDVAVIVRDRNGDELTEYNGIIAAGGSPGWEQIGSILYAPVVKKNQDGRSSRLLIANAGAVDTYAYVQYYDGAGNAIGSSVSLPLAVNGSGRIFPDNCTASPCSAKIWSSNGQPLAAVVIERSDANQRARTMHNTFSSGATNNFVPIIKKNHNGHYTNLSVRNLGTQATQVRMTCYGSDGSQNDCGAKNVPAKGTVVFRMSEVTVLPDGYRGSALLSTTPAQAIATVIQEDAPAYKLSTNAAVGGSFTAYAPEVYGEYSQGGQIWNSNINVQNLSGVNAQISVTYYDQNGGEVADYSSTVGAKRSWTLNRPDGMPAGFIGSAKITSDQAMAATVNTTHPGSGDTKASYTVSNR